MKFSIVVAMTILLSLGTGSWAQAQTTSTPTNLNTVQVTPTNNGVVVTRQFFLPNQVTSFGSSLRSGFDALGNPNSFGFFGQPFGRVNGLDSFFAGQRFGHFHHHHFRRFDTPRFHHPGSMRGRR
jgi:hypothetical protein